MGWSSVVWCKCGVSRQPHGVRRSGVTSLWPREEESTARRVRRTGLMMAGTVGTKNRSRIVRQRPDTTPTGRVRSRPRPSPLYMTDTPRSSGTSTACKRSRDAETTNEPSKLPASSPATVLRAIPARKPSPLRSISPSIHPGTAASPSLPWTPERPWRWPTLRLSPPCSPSPPHERQQRLRPGWPGRAAAWHAHPHDATRPRPVRACPPSRPRPRRQHHSPPPWDS